MKVGQTYAEEKRNRHRTRDGDCCPYTSAGRLHFADGYGEYKNAEIPGTVISHWMSTVFCVNYMGLWEKMNNPDFNLTGFREVKDQLSEPGFALSPKQWIERTHAIGITSKAVNVAKPRQYASHRIVRDYSGKQGSLVIIC